MDQPALEFGLIAEEDAALATRAAWLYHAGGFTQSDVAIKLGVTNAKAHRLISRANRAGLVRVFVEGSIGNCITAETTLSQRHGLSFCRVVPCLDDSDPPVRTLGVAAATFLRDSLEHGGHRIIGIGHGRTLAAAVEYLPRLPVHDLRLVSLLGGLPRRVPANPFEVIDRLAEKTGADAYLIPVPMFARSAEDRDVLRRQTGVREALALAAEATLLVMGIGQVSADAFLARAGVLELGLIAEARAAGAQGEVLGYFFDAGGELVDTRLHDLVTGEPPAAIAGRGTGRGADRAVSPALRVPRRDVVAVAGGAGKAPAINAVLQSGLLTGLITDELTARQLVAAAG